MTTLITAWASSPDGAVTVRAVPGGVPVEVDLSGAALRLPPDVLARAVLETAVVAGRRATVELRRELATSVGEEALRSLDRVGLTAPEPNEPEDPDDFPGVLRSAR